MSMAWCDYRPEITVTDLLDCGACIDQVAKAVWRHDCILPWSHS